MEISYHHRDRKEPRAHNHKIFFSRLNLQICRPRSVTGCEAPIVLTIMFKSQWVPDGILLLNKLRDWCFQNNQFRFYLVHPEFHENLTRDAISDE